MSVSAEAERLAFSLPESERAKLAEGLLRSLHPVLADVDEGVGEALRRDREMDENPETVISHDEFVRFFEDRQR